LLRSQELVSVRKIRDVEVREDTQENSEYSLDDKNPLPSIEIG
jgi:hypothetical protein